MKEETTIWEIDNLPNRITLFRVFLIPFVIISLSLIHYDVKIFDHLTLGYIAGWTFVIAAITDFFDGYIARAKNIVTVFGSFLDPIADKFLVVSSLLLLQALGRIPVLIVLILVLREMYITSLRLLAGHQGITVPVGQFGKLKTAGQMVGIPLIMASDTPWGIPMATVGITFIYVASFFSLYSAFQYSTHLIKKLKALRKTKKEKSEKEKSEKEKGEKE